MGTSKTIKVMCDYESFPLWDAGPQGPRNIDPRELPLSSDLGLRLESWAERFDATLDRNDPLASGFATEEQHVAFVEEGRALARRLAEELGEEYEVLYFNDLDGTIQHVGSNRPPD